MALPGAPVSGPGRLSRRTDRSPFQKIRELPDASYGEAKEFNDLQKQAPLANAPAPAPGAGGPGPQANPTPLASVIPLNAPTQRPDEPVTSGALTGPGPGPEALGPAMSMRTAQYQSASDLLNNLAAGSDSPDLKALAANLRRGA